MNPKTLLFVCFAGVIWTMRDRAKRFAQDKFINVLFKRSGVACEGVLRAMS